MKLAKPPLVLFFILLLMGTGCTLFILSLTTIFSTDQISKGVRVAAAGLLSIGIGELLNHPLQTRRRHPERAEKDFTRQHRQRNPCLLGNLLDICGLILLFSSISLLFFPYTH